ncbi:MAG: translation initiation factor IF-6 [archaeon]
MSDEKRFLKLNFNGDPNVGLHAVATDKFCLLGRCATEEQVREIEKVLKVPVIQISLYGTDLIGIFAVATHDTVLVPEIIFPSELKHLKEKLAKHKIAVNTIKTEHTALGNNILFNEKAGIISTVYNRKSSEQIKKVFPKIRFEQFDISDLTIVGSLGQVTSKGGIFSPNISDDEIKKLEKMFGFEIGLGTVNMGNPFVSSGIIANSNGLIVGAMSSGYEMSRIFESLGFFTSVA